MRVLLIYYTTARYDFKIKAMKTLSTFVIFFLSLTINIQAQIQETLIGNWINVETNEWEFGLFENFAVHDCDFWEYESVSDKGKIKTLVLKNADSRISLEIEAEKDKIISIKKDNGAKQEYRLMDKTYPDYPTTDTRSFPAPTFQQDSVTIVGYYRNFDKVPEHFKERYGGQLLRVGLVDCIVNESVDFYTEIDSSGKFTITIPVVNTQATFFDWGRLTKNVILEPGKKLFVFADMGDLLPWESDGGWDAYMSRPKQILFMGENARVNNELAQFKDPRIFLIREQREGSSHMEFMELAKEIYNQRMEYLNTHISNHPNVSEAFKYYMMISEKYLLASDLMQRRFNLSFSRNERFPEEYMKYVMEEFSLLDENVYTLNRDFWTFCRDYIGYFESATNQSYTTTVNDVGDKLKREGLMTDEVEMIVKEYNELEHQYKQLTDSLERVKLVESFQGLFERMNSDTVIKEMAERMHREYFFEAEIANVDSVIVNPILKELSIASLYYKFFDSKRMPLSKPEKELFEKRITVPYFHKTLSEMNEMYERINSEGLEDKGSIKNTEHLVNVMDGNELLKQLIEPYKGKVIYVDFWGTWCRPCRANMKLMPPVKEALKDEDVVFMYFANNSPEQTWHNVIKELNLVGENIVHYRLPDNQQRILEQSLSVNSWPTYMLIDKEGNIVNTQAPFPEDRDVLLREIKNLLD